MSKRATISLLLVLSALLLATVAAGGRPSVGASAHTWRALMPLVSRDLPGACTLSPVLVWPTAGQTIATLLPTLRFAPYTPTTQYSYVVVSLDDNKWFAYADEYTVSSTSSSPHDLEVFHNLTAGRTYYWRLRENCGSKNSAWSQTETFRTPASGTLPARPTLLTPAQDSVGHGASVTFTWQAVTRATGYQFTITKVGTTLRRLRDAAGPTYTFSGLEPNAQYEWWVTARNAYAYGPESTHWRFRTGAFAAEPELSARDGVMAIAPDGMVSEGGY
jgi:hypothetical protein